MVRYLGIVVGFALSVIELTTTTAAQGALLVVYVSTPSPEGRSRVLGKMIYNHIILIA